MEKSIRNTFVPTDLKGNSLDFLRLALALSVIVSHCYPLGGLQPGKVGALFRVTSWGELAVGGFFFLSGMLITRSYLTCSSVTRYFWHRFLRIFPGFWACLLTTVLIFGPVAALIERHTLTNYFVGGVNNASSYLTANALLWMGQNGIDGLLATVPFPHAFNGSLWTLYNEFVCYVAIAALGVTSVLRRVPALILLIAPLLLFMYAGHAVHHFPLDVLFYTVLHGVNAYLAQAAFFFVGVAIFLFRDRVPLNTGLFIVSLAVSALVISTAASPFVLPFTFSYVLLWLAFRLPFRHAARFGDFSYGLYIYAFPVQQIFAELGIPHWGFVSYLALSTGTALLFAIASWHLVERPCLSFKHATLQTHNSAGRIALTICR